jgi:D-amino peptidase
MKLLIATDMEGTSGVVDWNHVDPSKPEYARFRKVMTANVNAAIEGAIRGGATEIIVSDSHNTSTNILIEELDPRVSALNCGFRTNVLMVEGVDQVDAAMLVSFHARNDTPNAILCHTFTLNVGNLWVNGRLAGEIGVNAAICGHYNVPVLMVSSDLAGCKEAEEWIPGVETAVLKRGNGRFAAECLPPEKAQELITSKAEKAVKNFIQGKAPKPVKMAAPTKMILQFTHSNEADGPSVLPEYKRLDATRLEFEGKDILEAFQRFIAAVFLSH